PVLDLVLDRIAGEAAAEGADHGPGAAVADLVADDAARCGAEHGAGANLVIALDLDRFDTLDHAGTDGLLAKVRRARAGRQHGSEEDEYALLHDERLLFGIEGDGGRMLGGCAKPVSG